MNLKKIEKALSWTEGVLRLDNGGGPTCVFGGKVTEPCKSKIYDRETGEVLTCGGHYWYKLTCDALEELNCLDKKK